MTSEYVTVGHPDKVADYISEWILDRYVEQDKNTRYAVEVQIKDNWVSLAGEVTSKAKFTEQQIAQFVKDAVADIGYTHDYARQWPDNSTLDASKLEVAQHISQQSPDIAQGVDNDGWGDQGIFWGMAVNDKEHDFMPFDWWLAKKIGQHLYNKRFGGLDIKTQVTIENGVPSDCIVAIPLRPDNEAAAKSVVEYYVKSVIGQNCRVTVNGTGRYVVHASIGDCGTTGRKLAVDFYGGNCRIGGGSPWTKDYTKADLTLNLYARKIALDFVKKNDIKAAYVQIACCIGKKQIAIDIYDDKHELVDKYTEYKTASELAGELKIDRPIYAGLCKNGLTTYGLN